MSCGVQTTLSYLNRKENVRSPVLLRIEASTRIWREGHDMYHTIAIVVFLLLFRIPYD